MKYAGKLMVLVTVLLSSGAVAAVLPDNVDGDLIPDATERWLIGQGVTLDDGGSPINAGGVANNYQDDDADGIPNLVEIHITHTRTNQADNVLKSCPGPTTGQFGTRIAPDAASNGPTAGRNILVQKTSGISICHIVDAGATQTLEIYHPELGYADTVTASPVTGVITANWSINATTMNAIYFDNGTPDRNDDRLDGGTIGATTWVQNGITNDMTSRYHDMLDATYATSIEATYGMQLKLLDEASDYGAVNSPLNPGSTAFQLDILANGVSAVLYKSDGTAVPAWYVPSVGALHARARSIVTGIDADSDTLNDDKLTDDLEMDVLFTRDPVSGVGGRIRGIYDMETMIDIDYLSSPGTNSVKSSSMDIYAAAQTGIFQFFTESNEAGQQLTRINLHNVPVSATKITLTGTGTAAGFGSIDLTDNSVNGKTLKDVIHIRNRIPGFTDDSYIGVGNDGVQQRITAMPYKSTPGLIAPNGDYTFSFTGDATGTASVTGVYTSVPPGEILPAAQNLQWDGSAITSMAPQSNVNPDADHMLSWDRIITGGTLGIGAFRYQWVAVRNDVDTEVNFHDANRLYKFKDDNAVNCRDTGTRCSINIKAGTLMPDASYCFTILSRSKGNGSNRSRTNDYCLTTSSGGVPANDHNGDNKSDVMVRHTDGRWFYFPMNGRSVIVAQQGIAGITSNNNWQYQGSGDYNGDGKADILVRHSDGRWFYFPMNGRGVITAQQGIAGITTNNSWQYQGSGDMNGDGKDDVLVRHTDGRWFYFPMNGRSVITAQQGIAGITNNTAWQFAGMGDMNGDGKDDVLVRHTDGRWFYFPMNGRNVLIAQQGIAGITTNTAWQFAGIGDLNGDSKEDVLVRHTDGRWFYFPMNGRSVIVAQQGIAGLTNNTSWQMASIGDMNGDGNDDVMVRHTDGRWFYFPMNGRGVIVAQQGIAGITTNNAWGLP